MSDTPGAGVVVEGLGRRFDGRVDALRDVSFRIEPGEFVALSGPSGSGKSTLLQLVGGLDKPDAGRILVDGVSVGELHRRAPFHRHAVGFVFQLHHLLPVLSARANVAMPMVAARVPPRERHRRALALLDEVGLAHRADHLPSQLSGGERQRVAVARALANEPRLLLADEPTGALDTRASARILDLLAELRERHGMTALIATYDDAVAARADRRLHLLDGRLVDPVSGARAPSPAAGG